MFFDCKIIAQLDAHAKTLNSLQLLINQLRFLPAIMPYMRLSQALRVTNDKVFLTRSCDMCRFAKSFRVKAYFLNLNICQDLLIRTVLCFLQGNDA